jgi:acyl-CoA synthetase (AMP-forming)/AMP-acid ligase II
MDGYLGDVGATRRAFRGRLLRTGDLGYVRDGEFFWTGRVRERITIRGRKLDPSDFEEALLGIPRLRKGCFAAFGVDDRAQGTQRLVIVAEADPSAAGPLANLVNEVRTCVFGRFGLMVDDVVLVRKGTLTKTSSGKRRHRHFRDLYAQHRLASHRLDDAVGEDRRGRSGG